jgi:hypothetical protein
MENLKKFLNENQKYLVGGSIVTLLYYYLSKKKGEEKDDELDTRKKVNKNFYPQLKKLISIVIPSIRSKEMAFLILHTLTLGILILILTLGAKTALQIWVAYLDGFYFFKNKV